MLAAAIRYFSTKPSCKPRMRPIEMKKTPEPPQTLVSAISDIVKDHGPLTISEAWDRIQALGFKELRSKRHLKLVLRCMKERQKLRLICRNGGPDQQFVLTSWFPKPNFKEVKPSPQSAPPQSP